MIHVITNIAELAAARKDWSDQREQKLKHLLTHPEAIQPFDRESVKLIRDNRQLSVDSLISLRDAATTPAMMRLQASRALKLLDIGPAADQLVRWAKQDPAVTTALLSELHSSDGLYSGDQPLPEVIKSFVVACVRGSEPRAREQAASVAAWRKLHEAGEPLIQVLQQPSKPDLALLKSAAKLCPSTDVLRKLETELKGANLLAGNGALGAIADMVEATTNAALKEAAVEICIRHMKQLKDQPFIDGDTMAAVHAISKGLPADKATAALVDLVRSGKWRLMREIALAQFQETEPASARQLAGETGLDVHQPGDSANPKPKRTANEVATICVRHGLLTQTEADAALKALANSAKNGDDPVPSVEIAVGLFNAAGRFVTFDVETGQCPNRHDLLIEDFAKTSVGRFQPAAVLEHYQDPNAKSSGWVETGKGRYAVQFIVGANLYRFAPNDLGDWYDVEAVVTAIHKALGNAGVGERFVALESGGQDVAFIFAKPDALVAAAPELGLTLGRDLDQARKVGKAYEASVLKELRK